MSLNQPEFEEQNEQHKRRVEGDEELPEEELDDPNAPMPDEVP